ncbi:Uncharacterized protein ALO59_04279 [Pseudomonas amygdali pv. mellea]|uniref:hypothetical protein n=1 Tax=Pseudomonas amygdali TaxID=47877 RepID=UPI0006E6377B|nr:hypothetical protein [Pseudomonas amygdali]KPW27127.1 Uncharacterized protein ALO51_03670 [Pseudomonas amygdali]KPX85043.1 Uncharacterized protein ALO59_04279 [Pseudomonas amygdali pv. mellea]
MWSKRGEKSESLVTNLAGTLNDQPWNDYSFGLGINAESGAFAVQAVSPITPEPGRAKNTVQKYEVIATADDYSRLFKAEAQGEYNVGAASASASASYLSNVTYSETSLTILAFYDVTDADYASLSPAPAFTPQASELASSNPAGFRDTYGDYFVATAKFGSRFVATYTCSTTTTTALQTFKAAVAGKKDILSASGAAEFESLASSSDVHVKVAVTMNGTSGKAPPVGADANSIPTILKWFTENLQPVPRRARLIHYSQIDNHIPNTLPLNPDNFAKVKTIAFQLQELESLTSAIPGYYSTQPYSLTPPVQGINTVADTQQYLTNQYSARIGTLLYEPDAASQLSQQVSELTRSLQPSLALFSFYQSLTLSPPNESASGVYSTSAGIKSTELTNVSIQEDSQHYSADWTIGHQSHTFSFPFDPSEGGAIITGWYIQNGWNSETNGDWKSNGAMIGKTSGSFYVESNYDRGCNWNLHVYYLPRSTFPWLARTTS